MNEDYVGKWAAVYLPARPNGKSDPSRYDFDTESAARDYVFSRMCDMCKEGRYRILNGTSDPENNEEHIGDSLWPGCACEWDIGPAKDVW